MNAEEQAKAILDTLRAVPAVLFQLQHLIRDVRVLGPWTKDKEHNGSTWWVRKRAPFQKCPPHAWVTSSDEEEGGFEWESMDSGWGERRPTLEEACAACDAHLKSQGWLLS